MTTVEFLHSKGLKKWKNLQVTSDEHNKVIFLKELLEEYHEMKQKLLKHGVSGKRPHCPYCMEPISERMIEEWTNWLRNAKAACASGGVDTVAERWVKYCEWCQLETPIKDNKCSECGKPCAEVL